MIWETEAREPILVTQTLLSKIFRHFQSYINESDTLNLDSISLTLMRAQPVLFLFFSFLFFSFIYFY